MDGTNHSSQTLQSLSPDKREGLEHELRPEALASIAREENAEASTNTTHAAVSPKESTKTRAETASTGLVPPHESSTHTDRAVRTEASVDDKVKHVWEEGLPTCVEIYVDLYAIEH